MYVYGDPDMGKTVQDIIADEYHRLPPHLRALVDRRAEVLDCSPEDVLWEAVARFQHDWADPRQRPHMEQWLERQRMPLGKDSRL